MKKSIDLTERLVGLHEQGVDWKARTVWIIGALDEEKGFRYVPAIRLLDESAGPIRVVIMSAGGAEGGGFAIYDTIRSLKNPVITIGFGHVYSIATLILQAGQKRLLSETCELMMHNGSLEMSGGPMDTDKIEQIAAETSRSNGRYHRAISERSHVDLQKVRQWCKEEKYFSAQEAVAEGLADGLIKTWKDL